MITNIKKTYYMFGAAMTTGMLASSSAFAQEPPAASGNNFSSIAENITTSLQDLPGLLSAISYLMGLLLGVLGVLKIKDHVENPTNTKLQEGAVRLIAGGALFALPILFESMTNTIGEGTTVDAPTLNKVNFNVN